MGAVVVILERVLILAQSGEDHVVDGRLWATSGVMALSGVMGLPAAFQGAGVQGEVMVAML